MVPKYPSHLNVENINTVDLGKFRERCHDAQDVMNLTLRLIGAEEKRRKHEAAVGRVQRKEIRHQKAQWKKRANFIRAPPKIDLDETMQIEMHQDDT